MRVVYFFLVGLVSVLLAVVCTYTVIIVRKPTKKSLARIRRGIRNNKIFSRNNMSSAKEPSLIIKNSRKVEFIEDM